MSFTTLHYQLFFSIVLVCCISKIVTEDPSTYCEFGFCDETKNEYCCDRDKCCVESSAIWYFWFAGVLLVLLIIAIALRFYIKKKKASKNEFVNKYEPVPTNIIEDA